MMDNTVEILSYGILISGTIGFLLLVSGIRAPYGRYSQQFHPSISAKLAWFIQEIPSLYIPFYNLTTGIIDLSLINALILILFCLHYTNRALIYPFLIKGNTKTPIYLVLLGFLFCTVNGYIQSIWHSHNVVYNNSLKDIVFCFIGTIIFITIRYLMAVYSNIFLEQISLANVSNGLVMPYWHAHYLLLLLHFLHFAILHRVLINIIDGIEKNLTIIPRIAKLLYHLLFRTILSQSNEKELN
ncbi:3-oxo-5-alpha-steroid 4-dehydrogenase [Dirofilaria immitis]